MWVHFLLLSIVFSGCRSSDDPPPPLIHLNSDLQPNQSEVVLTSGTSFILRCHGNGTVQWSKFSLANASGLPDPLVVENADPKTTGTYLCGYTDQNLRHLDTWIHLYVKYPTDSTNVFITPRKSLQTVKEGEDFRFKCLLTDPSVKNVTLRSLNRGQGLPHGMNVTFDPKRGALIRDVQMSYKGFYMCSGKRDGKEVNSAPLELQVNHRLRSLPLLNVSQDKVILLVGEKFEVTCSVSNPSNFYTLTWTHPHRQVLDILRFDSYDGLYRQTQTLTVSEVNLTDSGMYTCTAVNEAGVATATTHLTVIDRPYLKIYLHVPQHANASSSVVEANGHLVSNVSTNKTVDGTVNRVHINGSSRLEVSDGRDVMLSFLLEAYPPITEHHWMTPKHVTSDNDTVYEESYISDGYRLEARLLLRRVRQEDRGQYSFHFSNSFFSGSQTVNLKIHYRPSAKITLENNTLTCQSFGYPLPTIQWFTCPGQQDRCGTDSTNQLSVTDEADEDEEELEEESEEFMQEEEEDEEENVEYLRLPLSDDDDVTVTVTCVAANHMGESFHVAHIQQPLSATSTLFTPLLIGALSSAAVLLLLLSVALYKWKQKPKYEIRWKIIESTDGNHYTFVDPTQLPYNQKWEFPRDKLRLGAVLGSGAFGKVVEATAYGLGTDNNVTRVAVKMLKPSAHSEEREALMSELKILSHLGYHDNIVNLLGACTRGGPMLMITEYCCHGDLLNFLRSEAHDFVASILNVGEVTEEVFYKNMTSLNARLRSDSGISCSSDYQEMQPVLSPGQTQSGVLTHSLSVEDLMRFSYQVAQGLDFLSTRNCIHRDVAARNVLLTDRRIAKICDFGLARDIRNDDSYIVQGNARLPVKWMAPESIFECVYTVQSDVWSYGVLLWEIFSLGKSPYPNIAVDTNFYKMIKDGRHMDQPDFAPAEMYKLMTLCWNLEATQRPTFKTIGQLIRRLVPSISDKTPHRKDQSMYRNINECHEEEEDEEMRGGDKLKREDEEHGQRDHRPDAEEMEPMIHNIYQLS
ncbi:macrophage colony-stimulating factor 1 receptor 2 [Sphaeramia orbicularis]|uniref:receptor protein-tyrosine kinase n=1 Tax=Sphaeramia orbicularis TaxID=375764 RepID=A0A673BWL9_9TELE|nr:macrophage colony-stimulating factor 1 receptor 2-like [Sphaeramia orbicularis]